ncbi:MAG: hypothetical protein SOT16_07485 [Oscillospiraceae bacterium]|nr:hypothetical protein [Oscillospiraceae bacterium]
MSKCGLCGKELGEGEGFGSFGLMPPSASLSHTLPDSAYAAFGHLVCDVKYIKDELSKKK